MLKYWRLDIRNVTKYIYYNHQGQVVVKIITGYKTKT